jgi:hypothetical protein
VPPPWGGKVVDASRPLRHVTEVVFFGRLEVRKGIVLFSDTLDLLTVGGAASLLPAGTRVTFLGSDRNTVGAVNGGDYARQRARRCVGHRRPCGSCVACCRWMTEPRTSPPSASAESCMLCAPHVSRLMVEPLAGGSTDGPEWRLR